MSEELKQRILDFLRENGEHPTGEIASVLNVSREKVRYALTLLAADGLVKRRKLSPKVILWSVTEKAKQ